MQNYSPGIKKFIFIVSVFLIMTSRLSAYNPGSEGVFPDQGIVPNPEPFSLDAGSAIYCIHLLKTVKFYELRDEDGKSEIVNVETVWSWFLEYDEEFPEGFRKRYDIIVNGSALDWDNSFIEYGGEMINLRLLFLYRNQHPPEGLPQYIQP